ncbi:unnamed protein product [Schistosoma spindalis]|nr:unnamed protein product [Schistosoma spindale]
MAIWHYFFPIQMIIMIVGFALLISRANWYELIISVPGAIGFAILAIVLGEKLRDLKRKWRILLFTMCCAFAAAGLILLVVGVTLGMNVLQGLACNFCCCVMFIVIIFTTYYLDIYREQEQFSEIYIIFVWFYEYFMFNVFLQFSLNSFFHCEYSSNRNLRQ